MTDLIVHQVNIAHYRLIELAKLADQAKPFYDWVEKHAKRVTGSHKLLSEIILTCTRAELHEIIQACYADQPDTRPLLFDGIGRVYPHKKACFYFFAWMIRDAPQQRLSPLVARMQKLDDCSRLTAETDTLVELILEYRLLVRTFEWIAVREVVMDRLEGSRRSISGHYLEAHVRTALITAIQHFYSIYDNYGEFKEVVIANSQINIGRHTVDVSAKLLPKSGDAVTQLLIPVKTRETEGGGHAHLFTRDVITAISDINAAVSNCHIVVVIIAQNWSARELENIAHQIDQVFHFNMSPNSFVGFDDESQYKLNRYVEKMLGGQLD